MTRNSIHMFQLGKTIVSEGIDANYQDMINYSVFALILMKFGN